VCAVHTHPSLPSRDRRPTVPIWLHMSCSPLLTEVQPRLAPHARAAERLRVKAPFDPCGCTEELV
jgi:hypothetical protein